MASAEIESFRLRFEYEFDRLLETITDLDEKAVNWKPPVPSANSLLVLVTHALASAEDNVVRRGAGKTVVRNRDAEFAVTGGTSHLIARAKEVRGRIADALASLEGRLDEERESTFGKWPARWTVRDSLVHAISHTAEHAGHAQLTRDLYNAKRGEHMKAKVAGEGTKAKPWKLKTPSGSSEYEMYRAEDADPPAIVCMVGKTELRYHLRAIEDLHAMLKKHGDWMLLGSADEQKPAAEGTVEAWGRSPKNPVKGWYGLKKGLRGRFGMYMPPLLEALGLAEVEHNPKNNRMRAV